MGQLSARSLPVPHLLLLSLLVIFVAVRIAALIHFRADLQTDPDIYLALARGLASGEGLSAPETGEPTAFRPPLYPMLLTPFCLPDQVLGRAILHLILSFLTLLALCQLGKNLELSRPQILLAGFLFAFDPLAVRYIALPMTETLCTCLVTILLMQLTQKTQTLRSLFETGVIFGLAVLSRPTFWAFGLIYGPLWLIRAWLLRKENPETYWRLPLAAASSCVLAGVGLIVLPWLIRNLVQLHAPILMTTHGGYTLFLGNNGAFYREVVAQPSRTIWDGSHGPGQQAWLKTILAQAAADGASGEVALDRWMAAQAKREIVANPILFLRACLLKFCWFWSLGPQGPESARLPGILLLAIRLFYGLFLGAALAGGIRTFFLKRFTSPCPLLPQGMWLAPQTSATSRHSDPVTTIVWRWWLVLIFVGSLMLPHLVYWSDTRMRAPITPVLALLAASLLPSFQRSLSCESADSEPESK